MDKLGPVPIDEIDFALADELVVELCEERAAIERAEAEGVPLTHSIRDPRTGRSYEARRRGISNGSIREALDTPSDFSATRTSGASSPGRLLR